MSDGRRMWISGDLFAELENGHTDGHDEAEESELQGIPGLQAKYTDGQGDQSYCLQEDEHENRYNDFLQLGPAGLIDGTALAELNIEGELIVLDIARAHLHGGV